VSRSAGCKAHARRSGKDQRLAASEDGAVVRFRHERALLGIYLEESSAEFGLAGLESSSALKPFPDLHDNLRIPYLSTK
jgi:hypothetical protein